MSACASCGGADPCRYAAEADRLAAIRDRGPVGRLLDDVGRLTTEPASNLGPLLLRNRYSAIRDLVRRLNP